MCRRQTAEEGVLFAVCEGRLRNCFNRIAVCVFCLFGNGRVLVCAAVVLNDKVVVLIISGVSALAEFGGCDFSLAVNDLELLLVCRACVDVDVTLLRLEGKLRYGSCLGIENRICGTVYADLR